MTLLRGVTLGEAITALRHELGESTNVSHGKNTRDRLAYLIEKHQQKLADEYDWPFLRVRHFIRTQKGQRYYDFPATLPFEKIEAVEYKWNEYYRAVDYGIDASLFNVYDNDEGEETDPVLRYDVYTQGATGTPQIEIWPTPSFNGYFYDPDDIGLVFDETRDLTGHGFLRVTGIRNINDLVDDSSRLDLDTQLVILFAAAEVLAERGKPNAQVALAQAQERFDKLKARQQKQRLYHFGDSRQRPRTYGRPIFVSATTR